MKVIYTDEALNDLAAIADWLSRPIIQQSRPTSSGSRRAAWPLSLQNILSSHERSHRGYSTSIMPRGSRRMNELLPRKPAGLVPPFGTVIANEAKRSRLFRARSLDCSVLGAPRNDDVERAR